MFPNWKGLDDTLAMNHMYTFVGYAGQGTLCVEPEAGVTGFNLFVNNRQINTAAMAAGGDQLAVYPMETKKEAREMP